MDRRAFENQVTALLGPLQGVARRLTCNDADAEDLVADAVLQAWKALDTLVDERAFKGWIFCIMNNTFISNYRKAKARPCTESIDANCADGEDDGFSLFEQLHQPVLLWFSNPERDYLDKMLRADLERALDRLPEHHRVIVVMSDLQECSYAEIAQALDIPVGTVRSRLARARAALQKQLWRQAQAYGLNCAAAYGDLHDRPTGHAGPGKELS